MHMQKSDDIKFTRFPNGLVRLYTNIMPIHIEDDEPRTEYVCDMYELHTALAEDEVEQQFDVLVAQAKAIEDKAVLKTKAEQAQAYLSATDWMVVKCMERGLSMLEEYPNDYNKREQARNTIREAQLRTKIWNLS